MNPNQLVRLFTALIALWVATPLLADKAYKWVDDEGVTHYEQRAPANKDYSLIKIYGDVPADAKAAKHRLEKQRSDKTSAEQKSSDFAEQKRLADDMAKIREENCNSAKNNLKVINENARVRILGADGKFRYLSETERQKEIDDAQQTITANCTS